MRHLKREIGLFEATVYAIGCIIGAGIYVLIGKAAGIAGSSLWLSFILAAIIAALTGLSYAELASTFPRDSAEYRYSQLAFKDRRFSFGIGWLKAFTMIVAGAAVSLGFGGYLAKLTGLNPVIGALILVAFLTIINLIGLRKAMWIDVGLVVLTIAGLLVIIVSGMKLTGNVNHFAFDTGWSGLFSGATLIFFAFIGFETLSNIGEEIKNPKRNLPLAVMISVIVCTVLYILVALIAVSAVPWAELANSTAPLSDVIDAILGSNWAIMLSIMALFATASTVFAVFFSGSRMFYGLAEENAFPKFFMRLNKNNIPYIAVIITAVLMCLFILPGDITSVAFLTDFGALFMFMFVNIALIVLRYRMPDVERGFTVPLRIGKFPILPALGALSCFGFLVQFDKKLFLLGILFMFFGIFLYMLLWERKHEKHVKKRGSA